MKEINLDPKQIVEKQFKPTMRGYNGKEVDTFLDQIIKDYESFADNISELKAENERLTAEIKSLKSAPRQVEPTPVEQVTPAQSVSTPDTNESSLPGTTNYDILKRLSNLERHVFGQSVDNNYTTTQKSVPNSND
ncbi:cell division regulator GpsB [Bombilactobacillus thymidiniphilus]|uniref:Cell division regulator GpsB n=1 Tax=Bombilactobacillus thymidiniphilus TaxID=2923363 RepID=A0ABY4PCS8_9LACO|nr:cell division regulator GpsB [Bombilactobacillus thymidiniphilus]UQS83570.1 cell division regulator GpsB [Bombilactobacillus thymidiniphilus]